MFMQKFPSVLAFLIKNHKILLLLRKNTGRLDGFYVVPSSVVEAGESLRKALIRALDAQIGIQVEATDIALMHVHSWKSEFDEESAHICFLIQGWQGEPYNKQQEKHAELQWFDLENLPANLAPRARQNITMHQQNILYSESGW
jgi:ADP-ribose pyrophosphatase YjhB (NUDIX family)